MFSFFLGFFVFVCRRHLRSVSFSACLALVLVFRVSVYPSMTTSVDHSVSYLLFQPPPPPPVFCLFFVLFVCLFVFVVKTSEATKQTKTKLTTKTNKQTNKTKNKQKTNKKREEGAGVEKANN